MSAPETGASQAPDAVLYRAATGGVNTSDGAFHESGSDYLIVGEPHPDDAALIAGGSLIPAEVVKPARKTTSKGA